MYEYANEKTFLRRSNISFDMLFLILLVCVHYFVCLCAKWKLWMKKDNILFFSSSLEMYFFFPCSKFFERHAHVCVRAVRMIAFLSAGVTRLENSMWRAHFVWEFVVRSSNRCTSTATESRSHRQILPRQRGSMEGKKIPSHTFKNLNDRQPLRTINEIFV